MASWSAGDHRETDRREDVGRRKHPSDATVSDLTARSRGPGRRPARCTHRCARCTSAPGTRLRALLLREPLAAVTVSAAASHRLPWYRCHPGRGGGAPHCKREQENACVHGNLSGASLAGGAWRSAASASARSRPIVDFELPLELQPKLLRVLQEQEFERIGGTRTIKVDVRLVAATNRDLVQMVEEHRFRDDLYYRLNVFPIYAPPLRERPEDIEPLVRYFVQRFAARMQRRIEVIPTETLDAMRRYPWPGNVRELENLIERAVILSSGPHLTVPLAHLARRSTPAAQDESASTLEGVERAHITRVLEETNWMLGGPRGTAARLGMKRTTLQSLMKRLAIGRPA